MYAAILFDMDGTLLHSGHVWDTACRKAIAEWNIEFSEEDFKSLSGVLLHDILGARGYDEAMIKSVRASRDAHMSTVIAQEAAWIPGARELLASLHSCSLGIVTSMHENIFKQFDASLGIAELVDIIILADDVRPDYKPHPKGLLLACERLGVNPSECVYIGDQECDMQAAERAGMECILVRGPSTPDALTAPSSAKTMDGVASLLGLG